MILPWRGRPGARDVLEGRSGTILTPATGSRATGLTASPQAGGATPGLVRSHRLSTAGRTSADSRSERPDQGGAMRACEQCGLSIGDAATFCTVCGARADSPAATASAAPEAAAAQSGLSESGPVVRRDDGASRGQEDASARRRRAASLPMHEAGQYEKTDPARATALYREAILALLESAADPLDREDVRHDLLRIFDRLTLVLKREGLPAEALEEIELRGFARPSRLPGSRDQGTPRGALQAPGEPAPRPGRRRSQSLTAPRARAGAQSDSPTGTGPAPLGRTPGRPGRGRRRGPAGT